MQNISIGEANLLNILTEISKLNKVNIGIIKDIDTKTNTLSVELYFRKTKDGESEWLKVPTLLDVPMFVLQGGKSFIKPPIVIGDECIVLFNDRDIDNWFDNSSDIPNTIRMHSLSDGLALIGITSQKRVLDYKADTFQVVVDEGHVYEFVLRGKERDDPHHFKSTLTKDGYNLKIEDGTLNVSFSKEKGFNLNFEEGSLVINVDKKEGVLIKDKKGSITIKEGRYSIKNHAGDDFIKVLEDTITQLQTALQEASKMTETTYNFLSAVAPPPAHKIEGVVTVTTLVGNATQVGTESNKLTPLIKKIKEFKK